jgi:hypothetical protein
VALHTIGPWDLDTLFGMPDLRRVASPYGGSSFAEGLGSWVYDGIVGDYWRGEVLHSSRRQVLLYALYRQAATYVWMTPFMYTFGYALITISLPLLFILARAATKLCCNEPDNEKSPLEQLADNLKVVRPPDPTIIRNLAVGTAVLTLQYAYFVFPYPSRSISRPTCKDAGGRIFKQSDAQLAVSALVLLAGSYGVALVYYAFTDEPAITEVESTSVEARARSSYMAFALVMLALPGSVASLVYVMKSTVEQLTLVGDNWLVINALVDETVHYSEVLLITALFGGMSVGIFANAWVAQHPSVENGPMAIFEFGVPVLMALLAFGPRFYKFWYRDEDWIWAPSEHTAADVLAYISEFGILILSITFSFKLVELEKAGDTPAAKLSELYDRVNASERLANARNYARERYKGARGAFDRFRGRQSEGANASDSLPLLSNLKL